MGGMLKKNNSIFCSDCFFFLVLAFVVALFYAGSLNIFFLGEAPDLLVNSAKGGQNYFFEKNLTSYRPVPLFVSRLEFLAFGFSPQPYHAVSIALHIANAILLFLLARKLFKNSLLAFFAALFFAVFYMNYETVVWLAVHSHLLMKFFLLLALIFFTRFLESKSRTNYALSLLFFFLATFSEEGAIFLVLMLLLLEIVFFAGARSFRRKLATSPGFWRKYVPFFLVDLAFLLLFFSLKARSPTAFDPASYLLIFKGLLVFLFSPIPQLRDFFLMLPSANILPFIAMLFFFFAVFIAANFFVFFVWKNRVAAFALLFVYLSIAPVMILGGLQARYLYLPSMGAGIFFSAAVFAAAKLFFRKAAKTGKKSIVKVSLAATGVLFAVFCVGSFFYIQDRIGEWNQASGVFLSGLEGIKNSFPDSIQGKNIFLLNRPDRIGGNFDWDAAPVLRYGIESGLWILTNGKKPRSIFYDINASLLDGALNDKNTAVLFFDIDSGRFRKAKRVSFGENLLKNSGFEQGVNGWQEGIAADASKKFSGGFSGRISNELGFEKHYFSEKISVNNAASEYYYFSSRVFSGSDGAQILFFWWNTESGDFYPGKKGKDFDAADYYIRNENSWVFFESVLQAPKSAKAIGLRLGAFGKGRTWFDDLQLNRLSVEFE